MNRDIKFEIAIGTIFIIAVVLGGLIWLGSNQQERDQTATSPATPATNQTNNKAAVSQPEKTVALEKSPEQTVKEYYGLYISYLNQKTSVNNSLGANFVTQKIIQSYKKLVASKVPVAGNPFICAQDFPNDASKLSVTSVSQDPASAKFKVVVYTGWPPITVSLLKDSDTWKINSILCNNGNAL